MPIRRSALLVASALVLASTSGCYTGGGKPLPQLDYQNIAPLYVSAGAVDAASAFAPSVESSEAARAFTTPPDVALRRYAENRLKAQGYEGVLKFIIQDASVKHSVVEQDNSVMKWANVGKQDRYDLSIKIRMVKEEGTGRQAGESNISVERFITVPQSYSIAKRETTLRDFMQDVIKQIDTMVTTSLRDRMHMTVSGHDGGAMPQNQNNSGGYNTTPSVDNPPMPVTRAPAVEPEALPPPW